MGSQQNTVKYGELVVLGYNGHLVRGDRGRKRSKFTLKMRDKPNGVKIFKHSLTNSPRDSNKDKHSITYTLSKTSAVIAEYENDENTDMFQIGRSSASSIDFVVMDTSAKQKNTSDITSSTISRFACRILVDRKNPEIVKIFAAGFNESKNICLGESALKWRKLDDAMDGLTTNGILIAHPTNQFCGGDNRYGCWREVSVTGDIYSMRDDRNSRQVGKYIENESNILKDGTLINICGATLLWRSAEGLRLSPDKVDVEELVETINNDSFQNCNKDSMPYSSFIFNKIVIPRKSALSSSEFRPYAFTKCGHLHIFRKKDLDQPETRKCSSCQAVSSPIPLCMGLEPAFYVDYGPPTYAFNPCGHMATEKTIKYWANVEIPHGINGYIAACPFCNTALDGWPGYVKISFF